MREKKINVVFVTTHFNTTPNGPAVYANYIWNGFKNDPDIEFHIVAMGEQVNVPNIHMIKPPRNSYQVYRQICRKALEIIRKLPNPRILHVNNSHMGRILLNSSSIVIGQINDYQNTDAIKDFFKNWRRAGIRRALSLVRRHFIEYEMVKKQNLTICNSKYTKKKIQESYHALNSNKILVIYKAVDVDFFQRQDMHSPLNSHSGQKESNIPKIVFVGTNFVRKGLDILLESLTLLNQRVILYIIGTNRNFVEKRFGSHLLKKVENNGHVLVFLGNVLRDKLREILWKADIFVLPSRGEAFGVATLEAIASGLPALTSVKGGLKEIHDSLSTPMGWRLSNLNAKNLTEKIDHILNDLNYHKEIALYISNKKLKITFGVDRMIQEIRNIYIGQMKKCMENT